MPKYKADYVVSDFAPFIGGLAPQLLPKEYEFDAEDEKEAEGKAELRREFLAQEAYGNAVLEKLIRLN